LPAGPDEGVGDGRGDDDDKEGGGRQDHGQEIGQPGIGGANDGEAGAGDLEEGREGGKEGMKEKDQRRWLKRQARLSKSTDAGAWTGAGREGSPEEGEGVSPTLRSFFLPLSSPPVPPTPCMLTLRRVLKNHRAKKAVKPMAMARGLLLLPMCWKRYRYSLICTVSRGTWGREGGREGGREVRRR